MPNNEVVWDYVRVGDHKKSGADNFEQRYFERINSLKSYRLESAETEHLQNVFGVKKCADISDEDLEKELIYVLYADFENYSKENVHKIIHCFDYLKKRPLKGTKIHIKEPKGGFTPEDLKNLLYLVDEFSVDFEVVTDCNEFDGYSFNQTLEAYRIMESLVEKLNSMDLSPFEKFLIIHDFAAHKIYKKEKSDMPSGESRDFISAMTGEYVVCAGYAKIVECFCKKAGIECFYISGSENLMGREGHAANLVHIKDEKYGIDGWYFCDATWDSRLDESIDYKTYVYAALPIQDIEKVEQTKYFGDAKTLAERYGIPSSSTAITFQTFRQALLNVYGDEEKVELWLDYSRQKAHAVCDESSDNCFIMEHKRRIEALMKRGW